MKLSLAATAAGIALALSVSPAAAQCYPIYIPQAPNTYGPYWYAVDGYGQPYGPNYQLRPNFPPFQGMILVPTPKKPGGLARGGPGQGGYPQGGPAQGGYRPGMNPSFQGAGPGAPGYPPIAGPSRPQGMAPLPGMAHLPGLSPLPGIPPVRGIPPVPGMGPMAGQPGGAPQGPPRFATHPFARSPRDFFMVD